MERISEWVYLRVPEWLVVRGDPSGTLYRLLLLVVIALVVVLVIYGLVVAFW